MLIPLIIPKRNDRSLVFNGPFTQINTTSQNPLQYPLYNPYPLVTCDAGADNDDHYSYVFVKADGVEFGFYFPFLVNGDIGITGSTSKDLTQFLMTFGIGLGPHTFDYKLIPIDFNNIVLSVPKIPVTGTVVLPPNYFITNAYAGDWFNFGMGALLQGTIALDYKVIDLAGVVSTAFTPDASFDVSNDYLQVTLSDVTFNYTLIFSDPPIIGTNILYLNKWVPNGANTNYQIQLSDPTDDAIFQASTDNSYVDTRYIKTNQNNFQYVIYSSSDPLLIAQTCFIFANDFSWYDLIRIVSDGSLSYGSYFQDIDGNDFLIGPSATGPVTLMQVNPPATAPGIATLSDVISLGCWSPCANLLYQKDQLNG